MSGSHDGLSGHWMYTCFSHSHCTPQSSLTHSLVVLTYASFIHSIHLSHPFSFLSYHKCGWSSTVYI
ncbi:hypothetical protein NP493_532g03010 [Ridgeia piscesae]|uniref:Uncharacterized protein n=1 Tax=Ridgeia piscesae TaxID=27915 RepID=A0AAD9KW31_RIDPI|nr:hypothetical protein NP493_532g03010 [Ridgeia piscesae]